MCSHKNKDPIIMDYADDLQQTGISPIAIMNVLATLNEDPKLLPFPLNERDLKHRNLNSNSVASIRFKQWVMYLLTSSLYNDIN